MAETADIADFLSTIAPYDNLPDDIRVQLAGTFQLRTAKAGETIYTLGERLDGLYLIRDGAVQVDDANGEPLSFLRARNTFGERGLMRDGLAATSARATADTELLMMPAGRFRALIDAEPEFHDFFARSRPAQRAARTPTLAETQVEALMSRATATCAPDTPVAEAARIMRDRHISSIMVVDGALEGILTIRDISHRIVAEGADTARPVSDFMTRDPFSLPPDAIGSDVLNAMMERGIGHVPIVGASGLAGIVTQTDLTRFQADSSASLVGEIAQAGSVDELAKATANIPRLLAQLVAAGNRHQVITRLITDITDAVTRRLLALAEAELGAPPVPYLWLACGSQGRQEQTGVSDQDNCLMLDDSATKGDDAYFASLAAKVTEGLNACGYVFCPGDMMASNPRWRQPVRVWRDYFQGWIDTPDPMAQMLASVMFDLRPIGGDRSLFEGLQTETLAAASKNSIFVAHMVANSLKHTPPLGLLRGLATLRSGEHRNRIDMKMNGVVPIVDLGRIYALRGKLTAVNTRARLEAAHASGIISESGGRDLIDAYDLIAQTRLEHQASQIRAGEAPDNYLAPRILSEFERSHLRDAFVVVRSMQSAATQGRGVL